jgi:hypothetical protein
MGSYSHLSDQELLDEVRGIRNAHRSPVITELADRLEKHASPAPEEYERNCPVCAAALNITVDDGDLTVK